jgi:putative hydrolase of the HAD superfamily
MKTVVFDFGAVLFHWQPVPLLQEVLPALAPDESTARQLAARIFDVLEPGSEWARFDLGLVEAEELAPRLAQRVGAAVEDMRSLIAAIPPRLLPLPDSVALLQRLKAQGHRAFYLSNMPGSFADYLTREHDVVQQFADGIFSARVGLAKPDEAIFELARERLGLVPAQTVFLDDHPKNVETARRLGWQAVLFENAAQAEAELQATGWLG